MLTPQKLGMFLVLIALSSGCNKGPTTPAPFTPEERAAILGEDANGNGIRDDVEELINKTYSEKDHRAAFFQLARADQATLMVDLGDEEAVSKASFAVFRAEGCVSKKVPLYSRGEEIGREAWGLPLPKNPVLFRQEIRALAQNTELRKRAAIPVHVLTTGYSVPYDFNDFCDF